MLTLRDKAFSSAAEYQRMTEQGCYALAQIHYRLAARYFRQWAASLDEVERVLRVEDHRVAALQAKRATKVTF